MKLEAGVAIVERLRRHSRRVFLGKLLLVRLRAFLHAGVPRFGWGTLQAEKVRAYARQDVTNEPVVSVARI